LKQYLKGTNSPRWGRLSLNPEFKDLAQTWGWKMITVHEKMYPRPSSGYRSKILFSGFGGRKDPNSMGKISSLGVPSAALGTGSSDSAP
jgi:hypothetical protein